MRALSKVLVGITLGVFPISAYAADFQISEPVQTYWGGFYAGVAGGWTIDGSAQYDIPAAKEIDLDQDLGGPLAGGQLGFMGQWNWLVIGAELQGLWSGVEGDKVLFDGRVDTHTDIDALALGKLRAGFAYDRFLVFGTGGYAGGAVRASADLKMCEECSHFDERDWVNGWFYGVGGGIAFNEHMNLGLEWNHIVLNDGDFDGKVSGGRYDGMPLSVHGDFSTDEILATFNYRF